MRSDYTHITMVLDRSGSMASVREDTIGGFNTFVIDQKAVPGSATLTLVQFDDQYEIVHDFKPLSKVMLLTPKTFVPRGSTALLDALGRAMIETGARLAATSEAERPARVLMVVQTDGLENASQNYTRAQIGEMITHQQEKYAWEFVFIGANQDAIATGAEIGVRAANSIAYAHTSAGTKDIFGKLSKNTARFRSAPAPGASREERADFFTEEDRTTRPDLDEKTGKAA